MTGFLRRNWRLILAAASVATILISVIGLFLGWPFFSLFLFFPLAGFGFLSGTPSETREEQGTFCPECGSRLDPEDTFCRYCGRRL